MKKSNFKHRGDEKSSHIPVLRDAVIDALSPCDGEVYVDGTFGAGGYTRAILESADCVVIAIDRDPDAMIYAEDMKKQFGDRLILIQGCFGDMQRLIGEQGIDNVDGITLDLGVSSMQLDEADRGFSFRHDGPLDMRMDRKGVSAADVVNMFEERDLARIIAIYGEERKAKAIAHAIGKLRCDMMITHTCQLAKIIESVLGVSYHKRKIHPATRTFQALRIYVNDELRELLKALHAAENLLRFQGRFAVVTFHSLEDRIVKNFFARRTGRSGNPSRHLPDVEKQEGSFKELFRGVKTPKDQEISTNARARSAKLRAVSRTVVHPFTRNDFLLPELNIRQGL